MNFGQNSPGTWTQPSQQPCRPMPSPGARQAPGWTFPSRATPSRLAAPAFPNISLTPCANSHGQMLPQDTSRAQICRRDPGPQKAAPYSVEMVFRESVQSQGRPLPPPTAPPAVIVTLSCLTLLVDPFHGHGEGITALRMASRLRSAPGTFTPQLMLGFRSPSLGLTCMLSSGGHGHPLSSLTMQRATTQ